MIIYVIIQIMNACTYGNIFMNVCLLLFVRITIRINVFIALNHCVAEDHFPLIIFLPR